MDGASRSKLRTMFRVSAMSDVTFAVWGPQHLGSSQELLLISTLDDGRGMRQVPEGYLEGY